MDAVLYKLEALHYQVLLSCHLATFCAVCLGYKKWSKLMTIYTIKFECLVCNVTYIHFATTVMQHLSHLFKCDSVTYTIDPTLLADACLLIMGWYIIFCNRYHFKNSLCILCI